MKRQVASYPLMACPYRLLAKPVDNLTLRVFQRYYEELCQSMSSCPEEVAAVLYSNELVTRQERSQAVDVAGLTPFRKAQILVDAVERRIVSVWQFRPAEDILLCFAGTPWRGEHCIEDEIPARLSQ